MMKVKLCNILIELKTDLQAVHSDWQDIFALHQTSTIEECQSPQVVIQAHAMDKAPSIDQNHPVLRFNSPNGSYSLAATSCGQSILKLASGAIICLPNLSQPFKTHPIPIGEMFISKKLIDIGQVEDVTLTLLAPIFRRFGIFIIHAFAAAHPIKSSAALIVGRSGQGKTTTGLALIKEGWHFLGNDAVFLSKNNQNQIVAWLSPGKINLHPNSLSILGTLSCLSTYNRLGLDGKYHFSAKSLAPKDTPPTPVHWQLFPKIVSQQNGCQFTEITAALALSQTLEQSIDSWDTNTLNSHFSFLAALVTQTTNLQSQNTVDLTNYSRNLLMKFEQP